MDYQVFRLHGSGETMEKLVVGDPEDGWVEKDRFHEAQARGRTRITSQNNPGVIYEIRSLSGETLTWYRDGATLWEEV